MNYRKNKHLKYAKDYSVEPIFSHSLTPSAANLAAQVIQNVGLRKTRTTNPDQVIGQGVRTAFNSIISGKPAFKHDNAGTVSHSYGYPSDTDVWTSFALPDGRFWTFSGLSGGTSGSARGSLPHILHPLYSRLSNQRATPKTKAAAESELFRILDDQFPHIGRANVDEEVMPFLHKWNDEGVGSVVPLIMRDWMEERGISHPVLSDSFLGRSLPHDLAYEMSVERNS